MKYNICSEVQLNNLKIGDIDVLFNNLINLKDIDLMKHLII